MQSRAIRLRRCRSWRGSRRSIHTHTHTHTNTNTHTQTHTHARARARRCRSWRASRRSSARSSSSSCSPPYTRRLREGGWRGGRGRQGGRARARGRACEWGGGRKRGAGVGGGRGRGWTGARVRAVCAVSTSTAIICIGSDARRALPLRQRGPGPPAWPDIIFCTVTFRTLQDL